MKNIVILAIVAVCGYMVYTNWDNISSTVENAVKNEKTIKAVNDGRSQVNQDVENAMNY